jgi:redox-sensitive bicupin YhaK (pirin superfamily)
MKRRSLLAGIGLVPLTATGKSFFNIFNFFGKEKAAPMINHQETIDFQWPVQEPFLFCVHHLDHYPSGNKNFGVGSEHFKGRNMGQDFNLKDGFRLYHGTEIPGFPVHPHRGFETITIVRKGYIDHADSMGAAGRYGEGDVQWMTAGSGVQHSEMFPLLHQDKLNTVELFQIWLNLPSKNKMVNPDFKMLWADTIPKIKPNDRLEISLICGEYSGHQFRQTPPKSWASDPNHHVNIMLVKLKAGGKFEYPASKEKVNRSFYFFEGSGLKVNQELVSTKKAIFFDSSVDLSLENLKEDAEFLILESKAINEPIVQHGPFVMNSREEIYQTIQDYQRTQFGGWKWPRHDMIHGSKIERFAKFPDGRLEKPGNQSA